jgi:hypothetical protein
MIGENKKYMGRKTEGKIFCHFSIKFFIIKCAASTARRPIADAAQGKTK